MSDTTTTTTPTHPSHPTVLEALQMARAAMTNDRYNRAREGMEEAWTATTEVINTITSTRGLDALTENARSMAMELNSAAVLLLDLEQAARNGAEQTRRWYKADQATREALGEAGITLLPESEEAADGVRQLHSRLLEARAIQAAPAVPETIDARRRERDEAHTLADCLSDCAKLLGLPPVFQAGNIPHALKKLQAELQAVQEVAGLLKANTRGTCFSSPTGVPTLRDMVQEILGESAKHATNVRHWRENAGKLEASVKVLTEERDKLQLQAEECHGLLDLRGGPAKVLRARIADILTDRDNCQKRQGEIQAELDATKQRLTLEVGRADKAQADLATLQATHEKLQELERQHGQEIVVLKDHRDKLQAGAREHSARMSEARREYEEARAGHDRDLQEAKKEAEGYAQDSIARQTRIDEAIHILEAYAPRRGSMIEKAIRALHGQTPPDRHLEPLFPVLEALWDDEPHHPTPAIRQDAIDAEDRRILASAGQPINRQ